ncbi:MAG: response regulator [Bacteroidetes bacterium]|nr:response regulator [Bacteroidota bacterium]
MSALKLLIVDDEPGIRSGAERVLRDFSVGYPFMDEDFTFEIYEAETGEKAIEMIDSTPFDIILLDNKLPGIDGIEVLEYIKNKEYDISVMMITSYASLELAIKATNNGAFNFVPKPFTPQELKTSVENITKNLFLRRMTRKMKEEGKQIRFQFLSVLSHELKSPINAVEGYLKMMKDKQIGNNLDDYMEMVERSIERIKGMRNLILDLLDLTRMESGKKNRDLRTIDIIEIAKTVVDSVEPLAIQRNIKLKIESDDTLFMTADKNEVEIILNNLISNAVKYNKEDGEVFVSLRKTASNIDIVIKDTGIGMSEDEIGLLFQDFVRIKNNKTKFITGSGLGLSIAKKMVELYKGTIMVESTPDVGSKFIIKIPV